MVGLSASPTTSTTHHVIDNMAAVMDDSSTVVSKDEGSTGNNQNQTNQSGQQQDNMSVHSARTNRSSTTSAAAAAYAQLLRQPYYPPQGVPMAYPSYGGAPPTLAGPGIDTNNQNLATSMPQPPMPYYHPYGMPGMHGMPGMPNMHGLPGMPAMQGMPAMPGMPGMPVPHPATAAGAEGSSLYLLNVLQQKEDELSQVRDQLSDLQMKLTKALSRAEDLEKQMEQKCQLVELQTKQSLQEEFQKERQSIHKQQQEAIQQLQQHHEQTLKEFVLSLPQPPVQQQNGTTTTLSVAMSKSAARKLERIQEFGPYYPSDFDESSTVDDSTTQTSRDDKDDGAHVYKTEPGKENFKPSASDAKKELPKESHAESDNVNININNNSSNTNEEAPIGGFSSDRFAPRVVDNSNEDEVDDDDDDGADDDVSSLGNTVASSTFGDDRQKAKDKQVKDPYGETGLYTGIVLRSTGLPHGRGKMIYVGDDRVYDGDWRHGRWHGFGYAKFNNGDSYEGAYNSDKRHGRGVYRWADGKVYDGCFVEDKRHGEGVFIWPDGATYEGEFVNGQREGRGKFKGVGGFPQYEGEWKDGKYYGYGTCTWEDGRRYAGEWKDGMANGQGTETYADGTIRQCLWIDDEPVGELLD